MKRYIKFNMTNVWTVLFIGYAMWAYNVGKPVYDETRSVYATWLEGVDGN